MYEITSRIEALSKKIKLSAQSSRNQRLKDLGIRQENLRQNLAFPIAKILSQLPLQSEPTLKQFKDFITEYNRQNDINLAIEDYQQKGWIRVVADTLLIPDLVRGYLHDKQKGKELAAPAHLVSELECLYRFYETINQDEKTVLPTETVSPLLSVQEISHLKEKKFLYDIDSDTMEVCLRVDVFASLDEEIIANLWFLLQKDHNTISEKDMCRRFFQLLYKCDRLYINLSGKYISRSDLQLLSRIAFDWLQEEKDLLDKGREFQKLWLDRYRHHTPDNLFTTIPSHSIETSSPVCIVQSFKELDPYFELEHSGGRAFHRGLIAFIVQHDSVNGATGNGHSLTVKLLMDVTRPYLIQQTFNQLVRSAPQTLPHLLPHEHLAPLALRGIEKVELSEEAVSETDREQKNLQLQQRLTEIWLEAYGIFLSVVAIQPFEESYAGDLADILMHGAREFFYNKGNDTFHQAFHFQAKKRFELAIKMLGELKYNPRRNDGLNRWVFPRLLRAVFEKMVNGEKIARYELLSLPSDTLELCTQLFRLCHTHFITGEISVDDEKDLRRLETEISVYCLERLLYFFTTEEVEVKNVHDGKIETKAARRALSHFGLEIVEWDYLYFHLFIHKKLKNLHSQFVKSLRFERGGNVYTERNKEQSLKLEFYLKTLALALFQSEKNVHALDDIQSASKSFRTYLATQIQMLANKYNQDRIKQSKINIFTNRFKLRDDFYYHSLAETVFAAISTLEIPEQLAFIQNFFVITNDLALLLTAAKHFAEPETTELIAAKINLADVETFIRNNSVSVLQQSVVDALNAKHFPLVEPLLEKVKGFTQRVSYQKQQYEEFVFEISLHIAYNQKSVDAIEAISLPPTPNGYFNAKAKNRKAFFMALLTTFEEKKLAEGVKQLAELQSRQPRELEIAYYLFHGQVLQTWKLADVPKIFLLQRKWEKELASFSEDEKNNFSQLKEKNAFTNAVVFALLEDYDSFFLAFRQLPDYLLFDEEIIELAYQTFAARKLYEFGYDYLLRAKSFYEKAGEPLPVKLDELLATSITDESLNRLQMAYRQIITLTPAQLIRTVPDRLNEKKNLSEFLLTEIIKAAKLMFEKIGSLDKISNENKYNDILLLLLRFRFPAWGLNICDQPRAGKSKTGKNLGELDFLIKQEDENIALIEALILKNRDFKKIKDHVLKAKLYLPDAKFAYLISYYIGATGFDKTWLGYQKAVTGLDYPDNFRLVKNEFMLVEGHEMERLKAGYTEHKAGIKLYHIFLNVQS